MVFENFHPASERWFITQFKQPTKTQIDAWQAIQNRKHTLVSAPTGSGKTLAAFCVAESPIRCSLFSESDSTKLVSLSIDNAR